MIPAKEALERLKEGNRRFKLSENRDTDGGSNAAFKPMPTQSPMAIVLGCTDSRVPAELIFDQGPGDLFVVRVAGNIATPSQIGSIEYAAANFGTRLVVVLGHSKCGAVDATVQIVQQGAEIPSPGIESIVEQIKPSVQSVLAEGETDPDNLVPASVSANVKTSVQQLTEQSEILRQLMTSDGLEIVGAEYSLETGAVEFHEG